MLVDLQNFDHLDLACVAFHVDRPVSAIEPHRPLPLALAPQGLVVEALVLPDPPDARLLDQGDPDPERYCFRQ
jgi:hypothetical protein